jgi:nucleotide-binding universal stress UspA family protein
VVNDHPDEAIVNFAKEAQCDLIAMASHGRSGIRSILIGSVTQKVLARATGPVLVLRSTA